MAGLGWLVLLLVFVDVVLAAVAFLAFSLLVNGLAQLRPVRSLVSASSGRTGPAGARPA